MDTSTLDYEAAHQLFLEWTLTDSLRRHAYAVEAAMAEYARLYDEDVTVWRITGLLHDMDYERHPTPEEHPYVGVEHLRGLGYPESILESILGHAPYTGVARVSLLSKCLFAVDELAGFVTAVAHVRPDGLTGMTAKSVRKKLKDRRFAAAVSRDDIELGAADLKVDVSEHIQNVIRGMQADASRIGF